MTQQNFDPTFLGNVCGVSGSSVMVKLSPSLDSGLAIIEGRTYRVAQVGSFVRIPQGYQDLFGIITEVTSVAKEQEGTDGFERSIKVELAGEAIAGQFERGISQHPNVDDPVHVVTEDKLREIYQNDGPGFFAIGKHASSSNIDVSLSLDKLLTRHSAVLGSTGSGKSTAVSSLLRAMLDAANIEDRTNKTRILVIDVHGEYSEAMADVAAVYSCTPREHEKNLFIPYWALGFDDLFRLLSGSLTETQKSPIAESAMQMKLSYIENEKALGHRHFDDINLDSLSVDAPFPFRLKKLWFDLVFDELATYSNREQTEEAYVLKDDGSREDGGDVGALRAPKFQPPGIGGSFPNKGKKAKGLLKPLDLIRSRLLDRRYDFLLRPGPWEPDTTNGRVEKDLGELLQDWLGHEKAVTILDLSGAPSNMLAHLVGCVLQIIYEALYWSRRSPEGGTQRPLLVVMEEAHRYLAKGGDATSLDIVQRIAKEGRKYGIGSMVVSQRPSEIDETILSQAGTLISLRLTNTQDRSHVKAVLPDNLGSLSDLLSVLRTGEAIVLGEAINLPARCRFAEPSEEKRPRSSDPKVFRAWSSSRGAEDYEQMVSRWRKQIIE
ncbi:ATP-binding protein [Polycladidibacter stylochi]|uniref:ATP-binding protein n=1 Tax=Polycladidibacter stylochi TaxID=1807766 RepID=UPI0009EAFC90|nr:ATP-binding protein [Pseudovibrio stylochi]